MYNALLIIADRAEQTKDIPRLRRAFMLAWNRLEKRVADRADIEERLPSWIVLMGNRRHDIGATELAARVSRVFDAPVDQD